MKSKVYPQSLPIVSKDRHALLQDDQALFKKWRNQRGLKSMNWREQLPVMEAERPVWMIELAHIQRKKRLSSQPQPTQRDVYNGQT